MCFDSKFISKQVRLCWEKYNFLPSFYPLYFHFHRHACVCMYICLYMLKDIRKESLVSHCHIHNKHTFILMGGWREVKLSVVNLLSQAFQTLTSLCGNRSLHISEWSHAVIGDVIEKLFWSFMDCEDAQ